MRYFTFNFNDILALPWCLSLVKLINRMNSKLLFSILILTFAVTGMAQTVTLSAGDVQTNSYSFTTNQIITINSFFNSESQPGAGVAEISFNNGNKLKLVDRDISLTRNLVFTGATNISVYPANSAYTVALTFTATIPTTSNQSSIPANAVVIPTDAAGPVLIILESSSDLVNWTSSLPGTYGSTYTNRFFRVRAIAQ